MAQKKTIVGEKYRLDKQVGEGGMSHVYLATDIETGKTWAAKELKLVSNTNANANARNILAIFDEVEMIKTLDHPSIPRVIDVVEEGLRVFVIMDYVEGMSLYQVVSQTGPCTQNMIVDWGIQICDVMSYLHTHEPPIAYRDMKPTNVMVRPNGKIAVIDFGIAREMESQGSERPTAQVAADDRLGTKGFASPEQARGDGRIDARSDIYSLGVTLFYLATGHNPSLPDEKVVPIRDINPTLSKGLERVIEKACEPDVRDRYQDLETMAYELAHCNDAETLEPDLTRRKRRTFVILACVAMAVLITGALFLVLTNSASPGMLLVAIGEVLIAATLVYYFVGHVKEAFDNSYEVLAAEKIEELSENHTGEWRHMLLGHGNHQVPTSLL